MGTYFDRWPNCSRSHTLASVTSNEVVNVFEIRNGSWIDGADVEQAAITVGNWGLRQRVPPPRTEDKKRATALSQREFLL